MNENEQTKGQKTHCFNQMPGKCTWCNSIPFKENFPSSKKKKTPITGYLETFIVMVSFFLSPQPSLLAPEKPARGVQIVETAQRKASRKQSVGGRERWGKKPSSLPLPFFRFFSPAFFLRHYPLSELLKQASARSGIAIHTETNTNSCRDPQAGQNLQGVTDITKRRGLGDFFNGCLCSYCCNRHLCYDGGRFGRVKIETLRVGASAKEGTREGGGEKKKRCSFVVLRYKK